MLSKNELQDILNQALDTGADFAEIFLEDTLPVNSTSSLCNR